MVEVGDGGGCCKTLAILQWITRGRDQE
jgi:hypothetical protein